MNKQLYDRNYPYNWEIMPLSMFAKDGNTDFVDGPFGSDLKVSDYTETGVRVLQLQNLGDGRFIDKNRIYTSQEKALLVSRCITYPGDIIIAKMAEPLARASLVPDIEEKYLIVADLIKLRVSHAVDSYYLLNFINFSDFRKEAERLSTGTTRTRISLSTLKKISLPKPPLQVQKKISSILSTIDRTITHTEALIEKYQQIKAGLMHDLFTRGIGADGKLRPTRDKAPELYQESSIGWIPKEWKVKPLAEITSKIVDGVHHTPKYVEHGVPFVTVKNLTGSTTIDFTNLNYIDEKTHYECYSRADPKPGDVLVTKDGTLGTCRIVREGMPEFSIFVSVALLRVTDELTAEWLHFFFDSGVYLRQLGYLSSGTGLKHIHLEHFRKFQITLPDKFEQEQINKKVQIAENKLVSERKILSKLIQQKSGLMHDLLTGKVQVNIDPV